jgi:hypothetical protein
VVARVRARVSQVGFVVDKSGVGGGFLLSTSVSPAKTVHSTNFIIIIITITCGS